MEPVFIDLGVSTGAKSFVNEKDKTAKGSLLHPAEFRQIQRFVDRAMQKARSYIPALGGHKDDEMYAHDTITVSGSRGSGKTSFLLSIRNFYQQDATEIAVLDVIDPTLVEDKGHIFLNILSILSDRMEKSLNDREVRGDSLHQIRRKAWRENLLHLAEGIPSMNDIDSKVEGWHDPQFVMKSGMASVKSARELRRSFNKLIDLVLEELNKTAFLLMFDDIDVEAKKGWQVLESIRKYCTNPKLIIIVSGDSNLYLNLVRQKKWKGFGNDILKYEAELGNRLPYYTDLVTDLASQYLQKVMPPKYRVHLNTLLEKLADGRYGPVKILEGNDKDGIEIRKYYQTILEEYIGITNPTQLDVYASFLLGLPLRSQFHFLEAWSLKKIADGAGQADVSMTSAILDLFQADIQEKGVDVARFVVSAKFLNIVSLKLLLDQNRLKDLYQLQPITLDSSMNASMFTLTAVTGQAIKQGLRSLIFDYFIRIAYPRNLLEFIDYGDELETPVGKKSEIENVCNECGLLNDKVLRDAVNLLHGVIYKKIQLVNQTGPATLNSFIRLKGRSSTQKRGRLAGRLDTVFSSASGDERLLGYIPAFTLSLASQFINATEVCYSIYSLLATIGEIVKRYEAAILIDQDTAKAEVERALVSMSQLREYPVVYRQGAAPVVFPEDDQEPVEDQSEDAMAKPGDSLLAGFMSGWCRGGTHSPVSPHLLGKIFTRFYFSMKQITALRKFDPSLGEIFHLQITAFFNSVIIEESLEKTHPGYNLLNLGNLRSSDRHFFINLQKLIDAERNDKGDVKELSLSKWLLSCPLLLAYINPTSGAFRALSEFTGIDLTYHSNLSVFFKLNELDTLSGSQQSRTSQVSWSVEKRAENVQRPRSLGVAGRDTQKDDLIRELKRRKVKKSLLISKNGGDSAAKNKEILSLAGDLFADITSPGTFMTELRRYLVKFPDAW